MAIDGFTFEKFANNKFYQEQNASLVDLTGVFPNQRIVDLACGTGAVTRMIIERLRCAKNSVVIGIDHSAEMLKLAMEELKDVQTAAVQFAQGSIEQVSSVVKESVDTVFLCNAIHYVADKERLLENISDSLKPGGKLAFNTSFFAGAHPPETVAFARRWMLTSARHLRREYGMFIIKSDKVESRKQLSCEEYTDLVQECGFNIEKSEIDTVGVPLEGWLDISSFSDFISGAMPGVPLDKASEALKAGVASTFNELQVDFIPRNWLRIVAVKS